VIAGTAPQASCSPHKVGLSWFRCCGPSPHRPILQMMFLLPGPRSCGCSHRSAECCWQAFRGPRDLETSRPTTTQHRRTHALLYTFTLIYSNTANLASIKLSFYIKTVGRRPANGNWIRGPHFPTFPLSHSPSGPQLPSLSRLLLSNFFSHWLAIKYNLLIFLWHKSAVGVLCIWVAVAISLSVNKDGCKRRKIEL